MSSLILKLVTWPDSRLKELCEEVTVFDSSLRDLAEGMYTIMKQNDGMGIAANQVGHSKLMFLMEYRGEVIIFINPIIVRISAESAEGIEGCLSFPGVEVSLARATKVTLRAQDLNGTPFELTGEGAEARCMLHELDHLNGINFIARKVGRMGLL